MTKNDCLQRAAECEAIAELLVSDDARGKILKIAERWRELAANPEPASRGEDDQRP